MKTFREYYEDGEHQRDRKRVAILPGGFKPPTRGHFLAMQDLLNDADSGIVYIGKGERDGIDASKSKAIWDTYKNYLSKPTEIYLSPISPVKDTYDFALENDNVDIIVGAGGPRKLKDGTFTDGDMKRYESFTKNKEKYPHVSLKEIESKEDIKGENVRNAIKDDIDVAIENYFPDVLNETDKDTIKSILQA
jgi:nicotinamide mononucleotide adenylyltransferase